jgi:hypothetical protein
MPEKPSKLMPALYGGIIIGLISGIPFLSFVNCLCCAGVLFGRVMAVFFIRKILPLRCRLTRSDALAVGALAGLFGALFSNILAALFFYDWQCCRGSNIQGSGRPLRHAWVS